MGSGKVLVIGCWGIYKKIKNKRNFFEKRENNSGVLVIGCKSVIKKLKY